MFAWADGFSAGGGGSDSRVSGTGTITLNGLGVVDQDVSSVASPSLVGLTITGTGTLLADLSEATGYPYTSLTDLPDIFTSAATGPVTYNGGVSSVTTNSITYGMLQQAVGQGFVGRSVTGSGNLSLILPASVQLLIPLATNVGSVSRTLTAVSLNLLSGTTPGQTGTIGSSGTVSGRFLYIKNESSVPWNITGSIPIYTTSLTGTLSLAPGEYLGLTSDGTCYHAMGPRQPVQIAGTLTSGSATISAPGITTLNIGVVDTTSGSLTNVGSLTVNVSGTTATIRSTNVLDTSTFVLSFTPNP